MSIDQYPIIETTDLDSLVVSYAAVLRFTNPTELLDPTASSFMVYEELLDTIRGEAMKLAGIPIMASAQFAIGLDSPDQIQPAMSVADDATNFAGRVHDVRIFDFTDAMKQANAIVDTDERVLLPGIVFETDPYLDDLAQNMGLVGLAPYCALLPSSAYELRRIRFAV